MDWVVFVFTLFLTADLQERYLGLWEGERVKEANRGNWCWSYDTEGFTAARLEWYERSACCTKKINPTN